VLRMCQKLFCKHGDSPYDDFISQYDLVLVGDFSYTDV
jgi:hypothetical protein